MDEAMESCFSIAQRCQAGALSPEVALMQMLIATEDVSMVERALASLPPTAQPVQAALARLIVDNRAGCERIAATLRSEQTLSSEAQSVDERLRFQQSLFDQLVGQSEEASVALYSLGNPQILAAATDEIVALLDAHALLAQGARVLDLGCGIGRMELALSSRVARIEGIDLSPRMIAVARRRCAALDNVALHLGDGRDLSSFGARSFELVLAVDSFPYVVSAGAALVDVMFAEAARVLTPGGHFALLNYSYRDDLARDRDDVAVLSARHGFSPRLLGERPFSLWDGAVFLLRTSN
jgi:cyclopropane fatty-acyl-phospholipid synthase-like methyltransferase